MVIGQNDLRGYQTLKKELESLDSLIELTYNTYKSPALTSSGAGHSNDPGDPVTRALVRINKLKAKRKELLAKINETFVGYYADEDETAATIRKTFEQHGYLADTHTSVALTCADKYLCESASKVPLVAASTASPYKFAADVYASLTDEKPQDELKALRNQFRRGTHV